MIRSRRLLPVVIERQKVADHLARLLDKLGLDRVPQKVGLTSVGETAVICIPDDGRDALRGGTTNRQHPAHPLPESESPKEIASVDLPPIDAHDIISPNGDRQDDDGLERDLGLR